MRSVQLAGQGVWPSRTVGNPAPQDANLRIRQTGSFRAACAYQGLRSSHVSTARWPLDLPARLLPHPIPRLGWQPSGHRAASRPCACDRRGRRSNAAEKSVEHLVRNRRAANSAISGLAAAQTDKAMTSNFTVEFSFGTKSGGMHRRARWCCRHANRIAPRSCSLP